MRDRNDVYKIIINQKSKTLYINSSIIPKSSDFIGKLNAVLFKPSDLELFTQAPSERRKILDIEIGKVDNNYLRALFKYNSLLRDKNKLLKELQVDEALLSIIEEAMVPVISTIIYERERFVSIINLYISKYYAMISGVKSEIKIYYDRCCDVEDVKLSIKKHKEKDMYYHYATFGPHREDIKFTIGDVDINSIASQGQKRMVMIAFKYSLIKYIYERTNKVPIVLLDDVLSELDKDNKERLLNNLPKNTQIILTNTDIRNIQINEDFNLINLKEEENV